LDRTISNRDLIALVHPDIDVHTLGIDAAEQILLDSGVAVLSPGEEISAALSHIEAASARGLLKRWLLSRAVTALAYSYRLDPGEGLRLFSLFMDFLSAEGLLAERGGPIHALFFAGLPETCALVLGRHPSLSGAFGGGETALETLEVFGLDRRELPASYSGGLLYDESRLAFGRELIRRGDYLSVAPVDRSLSPRFGQRGDSLAGRVAYGRARGLPPLMRAHVGPYLPDRREAVGLFLRWCRSLGAGGLLDVLSIGSSQLTQSNFGEDWEGLLNGGGVPLNSEEEFAAAWEAARPMLLRCYAGTRDLAGLAAMYERSIDMAWHALSLWWFCKIDGRGSNGVLENLRESFGALSYIASTGKPFEPNVPHHFAFRGADDVSYVVSGFLAAKAAKGAGVRRLVLQVMLNTPKYSWGIADLAKARALARLVRGLEGPDFRVYLQPRGGLDYFSPDLDTAKAQLAAVTALMDDIEPRDSGSPEIIHVVGYSEALRLADPAVVEESVRITRYALSEYRRLKEAGTMADMAGEGEVEYRAEKLASDALAVVGAIERSIARPYTPEGLYAVLREGFLAVPRLRECRDEFEKAASWRTRLVSGGVAVVDEGGRPIDPKARADAIAERILEGR
jgi:hypothetical protein